MKRRFDSQAITEPHTRTLTPTPLGQTVFTVGSTLAFSVTVQGIVLLVANSVAWALGHWSTELFRVVFILSFVPWIAGGYVLFRIQWRYLWAALERITGQDWDDSGEIGDLPREQDIRVVPAFGKTSTTDQVDNRDLRAFVRTICQTKDWTQASWRGRQLPSGRTCDNAYHALLVAPLVKIRAVQGYGPRVTGFLAEDDADEICERLGV